MENAVLVGLETPKTAWSINETMRELAQLVETAGGRALAELVQKRPAPDSVFYVGKGKADEVRVIAEEVEADIVVFDDELTPAQIRNLEKVTGVRVVDRTALILDIFAQRAHTREGKLQVELAQLNYILPRLSGIGEQLSRLGGGIGTRGPGETKLEVDRRRIRQRIGDLKREIEEIKKHRSLHRKARQAVPFPVVTMVGYTNAGKSTLLNALTDAGVFTEDKLFATLDPTTRKVMPNEGREFLLTDTVGFIRKLPHHLVASFRATLEEVLEADLLLHIVDTSHPEALGQMSAVQRILEELGAAALPTLVVFNKIDLPESRLALASLSADLGGYAAISAEKGTGLAELLSKVEIILQEGDLRLELRLPYGSESVLSAVRRFGRIEHIEYLEQETVVRAIMPRSEAQKVRHLLAAEKDGGNIG